VYLRSNGNFNLDTGLEGDRSDLLDNLAGGVEVDETLVDLHLESVPGLGTLTARSLTGGDLQDLGGESDGAFDSQLLVLGTVDEVVAELLQVADVRRGKSDPNLVDLLGDGCTSRIVIFFLRDVRHS